MTTPLWGNRVMLNRAGYLRGGDRMTWRYEGWKNPHPETQLAPSIQPALYRAYEAGADAMAKAIVEYLCKLQTEKDYLCLDHIIRELGEVTE